MLKYRKIGEFRLNILKYEPTIVWICKNMFFWAKYAKTYGAHTLKNDYEMGKYSVYVDFFLTQKNIRFHINNLSQYDCKQTFLVLSKRVIKSKKEKENHTKFK